MDEPILRFSSRRYADGITAITAPMQEQIYLVEGEKRALLIDTGMGFGSLKATVEALTALPVIVVDTHGHPDHAGGNAEFDTVFLSKKDQDVYRRMCSVDFRKSDVCKIFGHGIPSLTDSAVPFLSETCPILDGDEFDLGGRSLRVITTPGHTPGSLCLLDDKTGALFGGDTLSSTDTWLYLPCSMPLHTYLESLQKLQAQCGDFSVIYPGHLPSPVASDLLSCKIACVERVLNGASGTKITTFSGSGLRYAYEGASIIYDPARL